MSNEERQISLLQTKESNIVLQRPQDIQKISVKTERALDHFGKTFNVCANASNEAVACLEADGVKKRIGVAAILYAREHRSFSTRSFYRDMPQELKDPVKVQAGKLRHKNDPPKSAANNVSTYEEASRDVVMVELKQELYTNCQVKPTLAENECWLQTTDAVWAFECASRHRRVKFTVDPETKGVLSMEWVD